jgi:hypothetical protein
MTTQLNNRQGEEISIPGFWLQRAGYLLLGLAILFTLVGVIVSPLDEQGRPVLLLPEVKAIGDYRRALQDRQFDLAALDSEIAGILAAERQGDLFTQSRNAQQALEHAVRLAQQVDRTPAPPVAAGIHAQLLNIALAYLEAARAALQWVSTPLEENRDFAREYLEQARTMKAELEANPWLSNP